MEESVDPTMVTAVVHLVGLVPNALKVSAEISHEKQNI